MLEHRYRHLRLFTSTGGTSLLARTQEEGAVEAVVAGREVRCRALRHSSAPPHSAATHTPSPVCHGAIGTVEIEFFGEPSITFVE